MPTEKKVTRKLRAILSADVKGYSLLMADDEAFTVKTLKEYRAVMFDKIEQYTGRVVDAPGDNMLAEFASAVDAVQCAVEIQKILKEKNEELPEDKRLEFRIGVNIGDVIQDGDSLYGEGVNIAARIEGLADAGGVCISRNAYDHVKNKLTLGYEYIGEHSVKNIKDPVRVYKLLMADEDAGKLIGVKPKPVVKNWIWATIVVAAVVITSVIILVYQNISKPESEPARVEKMAYQLPEKSSIAVLPFVNMSGDPKQEYIADSITENIITALSYVQEMFVIARTSTSFYKGKSVKISQISEELGVRYILEGSIQKTDDRIRVTAQLIDAISGHHLWADRYDRKIEDFFKVLDEIAKDVVIELQVNLTEGDVSRISHKTESFEAWLSAITAFYFVKLTTKENIAKARGLSEKAIRLDPEYGFAWSVLGAAHNVEGFFGWGESRKKSFELAGEHIDRAIELDENLSCATSIKGRLYRMQGNLEQAIATGKKAISLGPSHDLSYSILSDTMRYAGKYEESIALMEKSMRLNPYYPAWYLNILGMDYFFLERYEEAIDVYTRLLERAQKGEYPALSAHIDLSANYIALGKHEEAKAHAEQVFKLNPNYSLKGYANNISQYKNRADYERYIESLRKVGYPDKPQSTLSEKPSIAVLPFDNLSNDPEQEYFSDGISEDIITDLSKISGLIVIARNSSFSYKGKSINVQQIGQELNVRYLLEGSVRKAGNQVRINAQLIDALSGHHLWADRYDGDMSDIFTVQDKISRKIISALALKLTKGEQTALIDKGTNNVQAYDEFLKGWQGYRLLTKEGFAQAKIHLEKAVELDTEFARAYAAMAILYWKAIQIASPELREGLGLNNRAAKSAAQNKPQLLLKKAMKKPTALAHGLMSQFYLFRYQHNEALAEIEKAISLDPNDPELYAWLSHILWLLGRTDEAIESAKMGMRLDPINPSTYLIQLGKAYIPDGDLNKSLHALERAKRLTPDLSGAISLSISIIHGIQGKYDEARTAYEFFLKHRLYPVRNLNAILLYFPFSDPKKLYPIAKALVMAGAPGDPTDYYKISKENRITGQEIKSRLFGGNVVGKSIHTGKQVQWEWTKDGEFQFTMEKFKDKGKGWVKEDVLFIQYNKIYGGLPYGATIYKNPDGSKKGENEYFIVSETGSISPFAFIE